MACCTEDHLLFMWSQLATSPGMLIFTSHRRQLFSSLRINAPGLVPVWSLTYPKPEPLLRVSAWFVSSFLLCVLCMNAPACNFFLLTLLPQVPNTKALRKTCSEPLNFLYRQVHHRDLGKGRSPAFCSFKIIFPFLLYFLGKNCRTQAFNLSSY